MAPVFFQTTRGPLIAGVRLPPVNYQIKAEYRESYGNKAGTEITALCLVAWADKDAFIQAILPDVRIAPEVHVGPILNRDLPQAHPLKPWLFADAAELSLPVGYPDVEAGGAKWLTFSQKFKPTGSGMAEVRVTFRNLTYNAVVADTASGTEEGEGRPGELLRYVSRIIHPNVEATNIGGSMFVFVKRAGDVGMGPPPPSIGVETPAKILQINELKYTWHMVPFIPAVATGSILTTPAVTAADLAAAVAAVGAALADAQAALVAAALVVRDFPGPGPAAAAAAANAAGLAAAVARLALAASAGTAGDLETAGVALTSAGNALVRIAAALTALGSFAASNRATNAAIAAINAARAAARVATDAGAGGLAAVDGHGGCVNRTPLDSNSLLGNAYPKGTILFLGCEIGDFYFTAAGTKVWDITYTLAHRPRGWNFTFKRSLADWREVVLRDGISNLTLMADSRNPFNWRDLNDLFRR